MTSPTPPAVDPAALRKLAAIVRGPDATDYIDGCELMAEALRSAADAIERLQAKNAALHAAVEAALRHRDEARDVLLWIKKDLLMIQSACGAPDAADACRRVIKYAGETVARIDEALKTSGLGEKA